MLGWARAGVQPEDLRIVKISRDIREDSRTQWGHFTQLLIQLDGGCVDESPHNAAGAAYTFHIHESNMFGTRSKGLYLDFIGEFVLAARTSSLDRPFIIEDLREFSLLEADSIDDEIRGFVGTRANAFSVARCGVYPENRVVSRMPVDGRKLGDEGYLGGVVAETLKIESDGYRFSTISPIDGSTIGAAKNPSKEVLVCGAPHAELAESQQRLLTMGVFPDRMEIGTVASIGGLANYLKFAEATTPTLLLEIGSGKTHVFVVSEKGVEIARSVEFGITSMIPLVQKELALKDEESARKLFFSNTFDFTGMGPQLTKRLLRELQASIGFYEVQTGQSINQLCCTMLPSKVTWLQHTLAEVLGMSVVDFHHASWLESMGIELSAEAQAVELGPTWSSLLFLLGNYERQNDEVAA